MSSFLEKVDSYQILTNLLPGTFFGLTIKFFLGLSLPTQNIGEDIVTYYFMGLIISRIGSLVLEPILVKLHFIKKAPYPDFVKAERLDRKVRVLSEMNNYLRSILACCFLLPVIRIMQIMSLKWMELSKYWGWGAIALLVLLFLFAYRKQTKYVYSRVKSANDLNVNETEGETK